MPYADPKKNAARSKAYQKKYGIAEEDFQAMLKKQGGVCAICGCHQRYQRLAVDHNHKTGFVRGLLCVNCNRGLGKFFDSPLRLIRAAEYLRNVKGALNATKDKEQYMGQDASSNARSRIFCKEAKTILT